MRAQSWPMQIFLEKGQEVKISHGKNFDLKKKKLFAHSMRVSGCYRKVE